MATYFIQNTNSVEDIEQMNNVIDKVNKVNTEATSNIGQLTDLNNKAQELSNNIQQALPINTDLKKNIEIGKPLVQEATSKNAELQTSLEKTKEFIDGLDGSQNIPQLRLDVTELQNGLKSNQALSYEGSNITANNTLEGRTEGMLVKGRTLLNIHKKQQYNFATNLNNDNYIVVKGENSCEVTLKKYESGKYCFISAGQVYFPLLEPNTKYTIIAEATDGLQPEFRTPSYTDSLNIRSTPFKNGIATITTNDLTSGANGQVLYVPLNTNLLNVKQYVKNAMIIKGDINFISEYFEGIKSFGESEQEGDKYKISILSHCFNLFNYKTMYTTDWINGNGSIINSGDNKYYSIKVPIYKTNIKYYITGDVINRAIVGYLDADGRVISHKVYSPLKTIELDVAPKGAKYILAYLNAQGYDNSISNGIMLSIDTPSEYLPYSDLDKKDILLKEPLKEGDYIYEDNGQVKVFRDTKQYTITGNENIVFNEKINNLYKYYLVIENLKPTKIIANYPVSTASTDWVNPIKKCILVSDSISVIKNRIYIVSDLPLEQFKTELKSNPITVLYQLTEPPVEIVENCVDIDLDTYQEKTYFNILNSLPGTLDFKVPSNIASIVQSNSKAINEIYNLIDTLILPNILQNTTDIEMLKIK